MNSRHALPKKRAPQEHGTWSKKAAPVVCASGSHFACGYAISLRSGSRLWWSPSAVTFVLIPRIPIDCPIAPKSVTCRLPCGHSSDATYDATGSDAPASTHTCSGIVCPQYSAVCSDSISRRSDASRRHAKTKIEMLSCGPPAPNSGRSHTFSTGVNGTSAVLSATGSSAFWPSGIEKAEKPNCAGSSSPPPTLTVMMRAGPPMRPLWWTTRKIAPTSSVAMRPRSTPVVGIAPLPPETRASRIREELNRRAA